MNYGKALTWDDLADLYDADNRYNRARTMPIDAVFKWASEQTDRFYVHPENGTIHLLNCTQQTLSDSKAKASTSKCLKDIRNSCEQFKCDYGDWKTLQTRCSQVEAENAKLKKRLDHPMCKEVAGHCEAVYQVTRLREQLEKAKEFLRKIKDEGNDLAGNPALWSLTIAKQALAELGGE